MINKGRIHAHPPFIAFRQYIHISILPRKYYYLT